MHVTQGDILTENKKAHDLYAIEHDGIASHIAKRSCREDYEQRVSEILSVYDTALKGARVLELGCGTGNWAQFFLKHAVVSYSGVDISEGMIDAARRNVTDERSRFFCQPVESLNPAETGTEKYDLIFSFSFIHHIYDLPAYFQRIRTLLRPGGLYLAMHEPFCRQLGSERRNMAEIIDHLCSVLAGWDMPRQSFPGRLKHAAGMIFSKFRKHRAPAEETPEMVDYQLSQRDFNHATVQAIASGQGLDCRAISYSYFRFPMLRRMFGSMNNFFAIAARLPR